MGTRADFYIGIDPRGMDWLGSIAWDGYPVESNGNGMDFSDPARYVTTIQERAQEKGWTAPEDGWPWPWEDSVGTDYAYTLYGGEVWFTRFGGDWFRFADREALEHGYDYHAYQHIPARFPDMRDRQRVTWGPRSGLLVINAPPESGP